MKHNNWFWGIFCLVAAVFVIGSQVGAFVHIGFWSIAATVLLAAICVSSLVELNFFGVCIPVALLYIIYQQPLHLRQISVWLLLLAAVLVSIGLSTIFPYHWHHWHEDGRHCGNHDYGNKTTESIDGNDIFTRASFSDACKYLHSDCLKKANLASSFGKLTVYFDQVTLCPEGAEALVDVSFGEMTLYLPKGWRIVNRVHTGVGSSDNDDSGFSHDESAPTLTISGKVNFGHLEIREV